jgi:DNA-binding transcriptional MerR regulator
LLALAEERGVVIPIIRDALDELLDREREHAKHELTESMRSLEVQVARLESALSTLQMALNIERSKTIDLPNVSRAVN